MQWSTSDTISVVAALAALASAVFAHKTYRATVDLKEHDFALQLQTAIRTLRTLVNDLPGHLAWVNRSHKAVFSARGLAGGSAVQGWNKRVAEIEAELDAIAKRVPSEDVKGLRLTELRERIVEVHGLQVRASAIKSELDDILKDDDRQRGELREDQRTALGGRPQPSLGQRG